MIAMGMLFLWAGYTAVYVGLYRLTGDKRSVPDIFMGSAPKAVA